MVAGEPASGQEIRRRTDLRIPVEGDTVTATHYEPAESDEPLPALLMYVPYPQDDMITYGAYDPLNTYLARQGYHVIVADMVGTGASTGTVDEMFLRREGREGAAIVEWLADQEWTTGRVGMYGKSYGGITALDAAAQQPEGLEAIVPIHTPYMGYRNAYTYGGLFELSYIGMNWLTLMQLLEAKPPSRRDDEGRWADVWRERLERAREREPWLFQYLDNPVKDEFWADKDIPVENIETPTFAVGGWRDSYTRDTLEYFGAIDAPKKVLLGPWRHRAPHRGRESAVDFRRQVRAWFDHFLKDATDDVLDEPPVQVWTELDGGGEVDGGVWRGLTRWPDVNERSTDDSDSSLTFALSADGLVDADAFDAGAVEREYEVDHTVGIDSINPTGTVLPAADTNGDDARSLTFETEPLSSPFECTGTGRATIRLRSTTADPTLSVRVVDVAPDGSATMVTHGTIRARSRNGVSERDELTPGEEYEIEVPLAPKSHVFEAGHRVRIAVAGAFFPDAMPTGSHGSFTVLSDPDAPSTVELPGQVRESLAFDDEIEMKPPNERLPVESEWLVDGDVTWEASRERTGDRATVRKSTDAAVDLPHADLSRSGTFEVTVQADDPDSLAARNELEFTITYPTEEVTVTASTRFGREFGVAKTEVTVDDRTVFEERWTN